jgi:hypothetical protein
MITSYNRASLEVAEEFSFFSEFLMANVDKIALRSLLRKKVDFSG